MRTREEDIVNHLFVASTHSYILIFSDKGRCYWLKVHEIPDVVAAGKGKAIANLVSMQPDEKIASVLAVRELDTADRFIVMCTRKGTVKKTELSAFSNPRAGGIIAIGIDEGDAVIGVQLSDGQSEVVHRHPRRHGDPLPGVRHPGDGPDGLRRARHHAARRRRRGRHGDTAAWRHDPDGDRERLRQAHRDRGVPRPGPRRLRHHQHPDHRAQRAGGRRSPASSSTSS